MKISTLKRTVSGQQSISLKRSTITTLLFALFFILLSATPTFSQERTESLMGSLAPIMNAIHESRGFPMDFAHKGKLSVADWRNRGRAEVQRVFAYSPEKVPLDIRVHSVVKRD